ncbi:hypothetical protein GCM10007164_04480 [Luteimonas padinae]|nr:hypothetical protein GCM10007164_04480 [Luteimonas padinae]
MVAALPLRRSGADARGRAAAGAAAVLVVVFLVLLRDISTPVVGACDARDGGGQACGGRPWAVWGPGPRECGAKRHGNGLPDQDAAGSRGGMRVLRLLYQSRINKMFARY